MTPLKQKVIRRTESTIRDRGRSRPLVIILYTNNTIGLRPLKTRQEEIISIDSVWGLAVKQRVAKEMAEKAAKKKAQRGVVRR